METASTRTTLIVFAVVIVMIIAGGALLLSSRPEPVQIIINPPAPTATPLPIPTRGPIIVYITGAVVNTEQTLTLPPESRVQDAIDAAGGLTENADLERVNLAGILRDGDQVHVPSKVIPQTEVLLATPSGGNIIRINSATLEEIDTLPGIGPSLAQRIIDYREANGPFASMDDLDSVDGIGPALREDLQGLISFD